MGPGTASEASGEEGNSVAVCLFDPEASSNSSAGEGFGVWGLGFRVCGLGFASERFRASLGVYLDPKSM